MNAPLYKPTEDITALRLRLRENGHRPVPARGKKPDGITGWPDLCRRAGEVEVRGWTSKYPYHTNTGILCDTLKAVDIDILDEELSQRVADCALAIFGPTPLRRVGRAPKQLFCYRTVEPTAKLQTPVLFLPGDKIAFLPDGKVEGEGQKVEVLGVGNHFVAFGIHPDTGQPYQWTGLSPLDIPASEVPVVAHEDLVAFVAKAEAILRAAGGKTAAERKAELGARPPAPPPPEPKKDGVTAAALAQMSPSRSGGNFFRSVNDAALDNLGSWVPQLFGSDAVFQPGTDGWRVSSRRLGRNLQEDLSISPNGIKDFGVHDMGDARQGGRTAIDLVLEHGGASTAADAALWLCGRLGVRPAELGWRNGRNEEAWSFAGGEQGAGDAGSEAGPAPRLLVYSKDFVAGFEPPDYAIDGLVQRRYLYSFTANTGHGKTAVALLLTLLKALGLKLADREIDPGHVLYFAGENPDDVRARWIALCERVGADPDTLNVHFLPGTGKLSDIAPRIEKEVRELGHPISLIIIDTSIAYFDGDEENNNIQAVAHARRMRGLLQLPGGPCIIVLCHPIKNASKDNLLPRGGGAFLNEVDGNLTCWNDDGVVKLHHLGKFRGPDFAPITFQLETVTSPRLRDSKGRSMPTVIAKALSEAEERKAVDRSRDDEDALLLALSEHPRASFAGLAVALGWLTSKGENKAKVRRCADKLKKEKLVTADRRGALLLTEKGEAEVKEIKKLRSNGRVKS
jgi:hypothetical protein